MSFENVRIKSDRDERLKKLLYKVEDEMLDIIMKEFKDRDTEDFPTLGLALGIYSITMQWTSELQKHTLHLMIDAQLQNERVSTGWKYPRLE